MAEKLQSALEADDAFYVCGDDFSSPISPQNEAANEVAVLASLLARKDPAAATELKQLCASYCLRSGGPTTPSTQGSSIGSGSNVESLLK
eukprot:gene10015-7902_t